MRYMSFSITTEAVRRQEKHVTRRLGWWDLKPGDVVQPAEKCQGLKKGEHVKPINGPIRILSTSGKRSEEGELLWHIGIGDPSAIRHELVSEGFADMSAAEFVVMFMRANKCPVDEPVNRIAFEYLNGIGTESEDRRHPAAIPPPAATHNQSGQRSE